MLNIIFVATIIAPSHIHKHTCFNWYISASTFFASKFSIYIIKSCHNKYILSVVLDSNQPRSRIIAPKFATVKKRRVVSVKQYTSGDCQCINNFATTVPQSSDTLTKLCFERLAPQQNLLLWMTLGDFQGIIGLKPYAKISTTFPNILSLEIVPFMPPRLFPMRYLSPFFTACIKCK